MPRAHPIAYEVTSPPDEDREIVVEEARADGWTPSPESKDVEETPTRFPYKIVAPKGTTTKANLVLDRTDRQTVNLTDFSAEEILARIRGLDCSRSSFERLQGAANRL